MKRIDLTGWAAIAEIVGTVAVVVSLLFVAHSVDRNTSVMQSVNDNFIYQLQDERVRDIVNNSELASIIVKFRRNEDISEVELERILWQKYRELNMWELAFVRHADGLYSTKQWHIWNRYFDVGFTTDFPEDRWTEVKEWYRDDFIKHVDAVYANK